MSDEEKTEFQNDALDRYITRRLSEELSDIHAGEELIQRTLAAAQRQEHGTAQKSDNGPEPEHGVAGSSGSTAGPEPGHGTIPELEGEAQQKPEHTAAGSSGSTVGQEHGTAGNQESGSGAAAKAQQSTPQRAKEHKVPKRRPWGRILAAAACAAVIVLGVRIMAPGSKEADFNSDGAGGMSVSDQNAQYRPQGTQNISAGDKYADVPLHENMGDGTGADKEPEGYPGEGNLSGASGAGEPEGYPGEGNLPGVSGEGEPMAIPGEGNLPGASGAGEPMAVPDDGNSAEAPGAEEPGGGSDGETAEQEQRTEALLEELLTIARTAGGNSGNAAEGYELTALTGWTDGAGMQAGILEHRWGETLLSCRIYENERVELCLTEQGKTSWYVLEGWYGAGQLWNAVQ
ncbi:MAG: hypothetical protein K2N94_04545 [Lachnospiraceae bacterium]|nr:hypothetical protein [Lachnospiraceae bacterium]